MENNITVFDSFCAFIQSWSTYRQQAAVWISTLKN